MVQEITASSLEQNSGANQINNAIQQLNQVTQQNASASEELATTSEELANQAEHLAGLITFFKLPELLKEKHSEFISSKKTSHNSPGKESFHKNTFPGSFTRPTPKKATINMDEFKNDQHKDSFENY